MKKIILLNILLAVITCQLQAAKLGFAVLGGTTQFEENFEDSTHFGVKIATKSKIGFILDATGYYLEADASSASTDLKSAVGLVGITYNFPLLRKLQPYAGISAGFAKLNSAYDKSPSVAYAAKAGIQLSPSRDVNLFIEGAYLNIDSKTTDSIQPLLVSAGVGIDFGRAKKNALKSKNRKGEVYPNRPTRSQPTRRPAPRPRGPRG